MTEKPARILISDVWSCFDILKKDRRPYGRKGEKVTVISEHENVYIVEGPTGIRFTAKKSEVTE